MVNAQIYFSHLAMPMLFVIQWQHIKTSTLFSDISAVYESFSFKKPHPTFIFESVLKFDLLSILMRTGTKGTGKRTNGLVRRGPGTKLFQLFYTLMFAGYIFYSSSLGQYLHFVW